MCLVEVDGPLRPLEYLAWTETDLSKNGHDPQNPFWPEPVYELFYSFHMQKKLLATVHYRRLGEDPLADPNGPATGTLQHQRTRIYPAIEVAERALHGTTAPTLSETDPPGPVAQARSSK